MTGFQLPCLGCHIAIWSCHAGALQEKRQGASKKAKGAVEVGLDPSAALENADLHPNTSKSVSRGHEVGVAAIEG